MKKITFLILVFLLMSSSFYAQNLTSDQNLASKMEAKQFISEAGDTLNYRIHVPEKTDSTGMHPLVLFLHGAGERGSDNKAQLRWGVWRFVEDSVQQEHPSIVVAPQAPEEQYWGKLDWRESLKMSEEPAKPMKLTLQLLEKLKQDFNIDSDRMYITGLSMGGFGTWDTIARYPDMFAAAAPVCGGGDVTKAHLLSDLPIWNFHGALDDVVPPELSRDMIAAIRYAGGNPGYSEFPDTGHFSWIPAYNEPMLVDWLFSHRKGTD
jgi:predicted peptidase